MEIERSLIQLILSVLFTSGLSVGIVFVLFSSYKKRKKLEEAHEQAMREKELELINAVVKAQEDERSQIARNLHDEVGATLSMTQQKLSQASSYFQSNSDAVQEILAVTNMIEQSVSSLRTITNGMLPHYLLNFGLRKAVDRLFEHAQESIGKPCFVISELPDAISLSKEQEIQVYYVISELLNNLVKHAKPNFIDGTFECVDHRLIFTLNHDGVAINQSDYEHLQLKNSGIGLSSIAQRVAILKGTLEFKRRERGGNITFTLPISKSVTI
jgi:signal transduction histidine kinase